MQPQHKCTDEKIFKITAKPTAAEIRAFSPCKSRDFESCACRSIGDKNLEGLFIDLVVQDVHLEITLNGLRPGLKMEPRLRGLRCRVTLLAVLTTRLARLRVSLPVCMTSLPLVESPVIPA